MDALGARFRQRMDQARREAADPRFTRDEHRAMEVLGLEGKSDRSALRRRYSELVRKYPPDRSEEHTSETPVTNAHLVCRLLLEKKNNNNKQNTNTKHTETQVM